MNCDRLFKKLLDETKSRERKPTYEPLDALVAQGDVITMSPTTRPTMP